jgi:hypothetical protein
VADATAVRAWAQANGRPSTRGKLPNKIVEDWNMAHPDDLYESGPPRDTGNGHVPDYPDGDFEEMFPDAGDGDGLGDTGETPPRKPRTAAKGKGPAGVRGLFSRGKARPKGKRPPRVSTSDLLGSVWRAGAKLLTPLPPLQRTLRMQAPVAGDILDDVVRDTVVDPLLQPLARIAAQGKTVQALVGPPAFVSAICVHQSQRASMDPPQEPHPFFMAIAVEGLRNSLMAWMDVAGPKFEAAMAREAEFEEKYGQRVDDMIAMIFAERPATEADVMAEEEAIRRAQGIL